MATIMPALILQCFAICLVLLGARSSQAATLLLDPEASQRDNDPIKDLILNNHEILALNLSFSDNAEGHPATKTLNLFVSFDQNELLPGVFLESNFIEDLPKKPPLVPCGLLTCINYIVNFKKPLPITNELDLGTLFFLGKNVNKWPGDGFADFQITGLFYDEKDKKIGGFITEEFEVQGVPAPLPLLGVGAAFSAARRLRRKSRQLKKFSVS